MQKICSELTLITKDADVIAVYNELQKKYGFELKLFDEWNCGFDSGSDSVVCTPDFCEYFNKVLAGRTYVFLNKEVIAKVPNEFNHFVDSGCVKYSLLKTRKPKLGERELEDIFEVFEYGDYYFDFTNYAFMWKGQEIYLRRSEAEFLKQYLVYKVKDKNKMCLISRMRNRFGKSFLRDVEII